MFDIAPFAIQFVDGLTAAGVAFDDDGGQLRIPARHPEVGDLLITFDEGEITVFVGNFTHRHFTLESEGNVRDALDYVCGILNDQWILWAYPGGAGGSYRVGAQDDPSEDAPPPDETVIRYLWSGHCDSAPGKTPDRTRVQ